MLGNENEGSDMLEKLKENGWIRNREEIKKRQTKIGTR